MWVLFASLAAIQAQPTPPPAPPRFDPNAAENRQILPAFKIGRAHV